MGDIEREERGQRREAQNSGGIYRVKCGPVRASNSSSGPLFQLRKTHPIW
uniref:Uncharacterized protein n=1 Tax=Rhizophora mucronata TaxID=61149 RepID=A0A2P2K012_RHIMU